MPSPARGGAVEAAMERLRSCRYLVDRSERAPIDADLALVAQALAERAEMLADAKLIVDAFAAGLFVRSTKHDHEPAWALALVRPLSALARFTVLTEPTKEA